MKLALRLAAQAARGVLKTAQQELGADRLLQRTMATFIDMAEQRHKDDPARPWQPGRPLKMLLAGYSGSRNTGADVRVEEMIRQFRALFGDDHLDLSILTNDPSLTRNYFRTVKQLELPKIFPRFLFDTIQDMDGVIACEGSMFKSKFANALSTMMVGSLGLALAEDKLAIGYGGEAGKMDRSLEELVKRYCQGTFIIARNEHSGEVLGRLGIETHTGTDTAWTFEPAPDRLGRDLLMRAGWDGETPILALCPINAFWWPVKPDVVRGVVHKMTNAYESSHYASVYFHKSGPEVERAQRAYIDDIAQAVRRFRLDHDIFVIMVGMEQLDRSACVALDDALGGGHPHFIADQHDMYTMVSVIRQADYMVSSRYHGIVCSMPGGVVSAGITMDERIANLMADRGTPQLSLRTDDDRLADKLYKVLNELWDNHDEIQEGIERCVVRNLRTMGQMGQLLVDHVRTKHPAFPFRENLGMDGDPWDHLPPLSPLVQGLIDKHKEHA